MPEEATPIRPVNVLTRFPTELAVAKLRAVERYCHVSDRQIKRVSETLADRFDSQPTLSAQEFRKILEETLREEFPEEYGQPMEHNFCDLARLYLLTIVVPATLPEAFATQVQNAYGAPADYRKK